MARLQAVHIALNCPQKSSDKIYSGGLTSKQNWVIEKIQDAAKSGEKGIMYAENPFTVDLIGKELTRLGIEFVPFHGGIPIAKRVKDKDDRFVNGNATALLATKPSARAGYNLPMADQIWFADRSWSARVEAQAIRRPLRVTRTRPVTVWYPSLPGSLDDYQAQMVDFKADSERSGIDHGNSDMDDDEFKHMNEILNLFVKNLANLNGQDLRSFRQQLKQA